MILFLFPYGPTVSLVVTFSTQMPLMNGVLTLKMAYHSHLHNTFACSRKQHVTKLRSNEQNESNKEDTVDASQIIRKRWVSELLVTQYEYFLCRTDTITAVHPGPGQCRSSPVRHQ
jgi:hypothetical protein